jgi:hypothetical protein
VNENKKIAQDSREGGLYGKAATFLGHHIDEGRIGQDCQQKTHSDKPGQSYVTTEPSTNDVRQAKAKMLATVVPAISLNASPVRNA